MFYILYSVYLYFFKNIYMSFRYLREREYPFFLFKYVNT